MGVSSSFQTIRDKPALRLLYDWHLDSSLSRFLYALKASDKPKEAQTSSIAVRLRVLSFQEANPLFQLFQLFGFQLFVIEPTALYGPLRPFPSRLSRPECPVYHPRFSSKSH